MASEWLVEASRLLDKARKLEGLERVVFNYFMDAVSVGEIRAVKELMRKGVERPVEVIERLVEMGLLERGYDCYNLAAPLRAYRARRGPVKV